VGDPGGIGEGCSDLGAARSQVPTVAHARVGWASAWLSAAGGSWVSSSRFDCEICEQVYDCGVEGAVPLARDRGCRRWERQRRPVPVVQGEREPIPFVSRSGRRLLGLMYVSGEGGVRTCAVGEKFSERSCKEIGDGICKPAAGKSCRRWWGDRIGKRATSSLAERSGERGDFCAPVRGGERRGAGGHGG